MLLKLFFALIFRTLYTLFTGIERISISFSNYGKKMALTGIASGLDVGLSNWSFKFITISLYTMTKSTCVIFILGFAMIFGLERKVYIEKIDDCFSIVTLFTFCFSEFLSFL